jgi:predicted acetyltransferase
MNYEITLANFKDTYKELAPLYRQHYSEMIERLRADGVDSYSPYNPRLDEYVRAGDGGWLLTFVLRLDGVAVGYSNVYLTSDMHNQDLIAQEDTIFVLKEHRNGVGKKMVKLILEELRSRGVKRVLVSAMTDLRVAKLWRRMGFKDVATQMIYKF